MKYFRVMQTGSLRHGYPHWHLRIEGTGRAEGKIIHPSSAGKNIEKRFEKVEHISARLDPSVIHFLSATPERLLTHQINRTLTAEDVAIYVCKGSATLCSYLLLDLSPADPTEQAYAEMWHDLLSNVLHETV